MQPRHWCAPSPETHLGMSRDGWWRGLRRFGWGVCGGMAVVLGCAAASTSMSWAVQMLSRSCIRLGECIDLRTLESGGRATCPPANATPLGSRDAVYMTLRAPWLGQWGVMTTVAEAAARGPSRPQSVVGRNAVGTARSVAILPSGGRLTRPCLALQGGDGIDLI